MPLSPNLHRGITFRIKTPMGWDTLLLPATLEGGPCYYAIHPLTTEQQARNAQPSTNGRPGDYRVVLTLAKPGYSSLAPGEHRSESEIEGDSNLYVGHDFAQGHVLLLKSENKDYQVRLIANSQGRLGKLTIEALRAQHFAHARHLALAIVSPTLSLLSTTLDIPLHISQVDLTELSSHAVAGAITVDYVDVGLFIPGLVGMSEEFRHYASMYREALNTNSPHYQFLCLFKIIESVKSRRDRLAREAKERGEEPRRFAERFPKEADLVAWLETLVPPTAQRDWSKTNICHTFPTEIFGRRLWQIIEDHLRPLRVRIAHGLLDTGELGVSIDDPEASAQVHRWLPATKYAIRQILKNEFPNEYLPDAASPANENPLADQAKQLWPDKFSK